MQTSSSQYIVLDSNNTGIIHTAQSLDGRVWYAAVGDNVRIDNRGAWRGVYTGSDGRATDEQVDPALWSLAVDLMSAVDDHNDASLDSQRTRANAVLAAREARLAETMGGLRGGYNDPNSF